MSESSEKVCVLCGQNCAGQPRIKNAQGQYAHQSCVKATMEKPAALPAEPKAVPDDDDLMGALLDDLPAPASDAGGPRVGCPGCGSAISPGAVVCMNCGFNTQTGKAGKTKVSNPKVKKETSGLAGKAGDLAKAGTTFLAGSVLGGAIGGAIGAAVWAIIAVVTHYEVGIIAVGVGFLCGIGTAIGSRGQSGMMTGLIAVLFTVISICAGKYFAISHILSNVSGGDFGAYMDDLSEEELAEDMKMYFADQIIQQQLDAGEVPQETVEEYEELLVVGVYPDEYPGSIVASAEERWEGMDENERAEAVQEKKDWLTNNSEAIQTTLNAAAFVATFGILDIVFFLIAIGAGYHYGSGANDD